MGLVDEPCSTISQKNNHLLPKLPLRTRTLPLGQIREVICRSDPATTPTLCGNLRDDLDRAELTKVVVKRKCSLDP